ncbi:hydantoinase/oxoprolinase family protein [Micromonospora sp. C31]|uniref:hydantoinase/oxoprolinase family protein n=1 Tax=Micromonospora sp. C31 TaxID=2824876 RepID=UPI001B390D03|nr:hydantoinase/oxoprolinase family protein [Micromonospora sp. C31]MBQ1075466.1 hydantoinase/oxoprolinase family protein [Micromonospora sp. C31]
MLCIGVDIGGTFTDVIVYEPATARLAEAKTLSTPHDPAAAIFEGLAKLGVSLGTVDRFVHGTTRVTNALLEGSGEPVAVLATEGFRDVLEMGLGHRPRLYSVKESARPPLVARRHRHVLRERIAADGSVVRPLDADELDEALDRVAAAGPRAVAVCLLHSYRNPAHERAAARRLAERHPDLVCTVSSDVVPEQGEYERFATTVLNASVRATVADYLRGLGDALADGGYAHPLSIMTSSGGVVSTDEAGRLPINLALSGPAGGVAATVHLASLAGYPNVITCDIGGTSTDVCLVKNGSPLMTNDGKIAGYPNRTFQVEINTIGAGGGSIAWRDRGGELRVGPRSAGSTPGPAAYGRGGTEPTTTDAHLLVGHLDPSESLGGEVPLDLDAARTALAGLAGTFGLDELELARGILTLATVKMTSAIKEISVACGHDPRDFVLMPFGGAGPMHATDLADELGIRRVLVPPVPGNFSALGFVTAQARHDYVRTVLVPADDDGLAAARAALADLRDAALAQLKAEDGVEPDQVSFGLSVGMRFRGQSFDLAVALPELPDSADELVAAFHAAYAERYAYTRSDHPAEIVNCRLTAFGPRPAVRFAAPAGGPAEPGRTRLYRTGGWVEATVWRRADLGPDCAVAGPAVVRENGSTTVVGGGWTATVDDHGNLLLTKE